ncbi:MAG: hypothetical protein WBX13_08515 [Candidatus Acidiferrales bacterium]
MRRLAQTLFPYLTHRDNDNLSGLRASVDTRAQNMLLINLFYLVGLAVPPVLLGFCWWGWLRQPFPQRQANVFFSGLCAGTANFVLWWAWVIWLQFHNNPDSWRVRDITSDLALCLLLYSIVAAIAGKGRYRLLLGISGFLAILPWIPLAVL